MKEAAPKVIHADDLEPRTPPTRKVFVPLPQGSDPNAMLGFVFMEPGGLMTPCHYHNVRTEYYFVNKGSGIITLDGVDHEVGQYGVVVIPPGVRHIWRNPHKTPLEYLWFMTPNEAENDVVNVDTPDHILAQEPWRTTHA
jgi:mannose-6-phosphate isomerase-like protein (cupin superfamily)